MTEQQPKSHGRKVTNPLEGSAGAAPELSLDFSRPPGPASRVKEPMDNYEVGEFSAEQPLNALHHMAAIKYRQVDSNDRCVHVWLGILMMVLLFAGLLIGIPYYLIKTDAVVNQAVKQSIRFVQKNLDKRNLGGPTKPYAELLLLNLKTFDAPGSEKAANRDWRDMECKFLIQEALSRRFRGALDAKGQYLLTNCQMFQDLPQVALNQITENYGDAAQFQRNGDSWDMVPLQLLAGEAQRRMQVFQLTGPKNFPGCRRWNGSPSCLLKFVDQAQQRVRNRLDDGYGILRNTLKSQSPTLQVWLGVAAAWNASKLGDLPQVEQLLRESAGFFPVLHDPFLEREIFRLRLTNAFRLKDKKLFAAIWKAKPAHLMTEDEAGFLDIQLYRIFLSKPDRAGRALDDFFSRSESAHRFRFDPLFIRVVVEKAIRTQRALAGLNYVDRILELQEDEKNLDSEWLPLLKVRLQLAEGKGLEALKTLQPVEKIVLKSPELAHLKGTAMLRAYSTRPYLLLAAAEFQRAANLDPRSEHFFALIVTFVESKEFKKANSALKFWQKTKAQVGDDSWKSMAQGLILYGQGDGAGAQKIWKELTQRNPGFELARRLLTNLDEDSKYLQDQMVKKILPMLPVDGPLSPLVVF